MWWLMLLVGLTASFPLKPGLKVTLTDIHTKALFDQVGLNGYAEQFNLVGICSAEIEMRGTWTIVKANKFFIRGDPITSVYALKNSKAKQFSAKVFGLGGVIYVDGVILDKEEVDSAKRK